MDGWDLILDQSRTPTFGDISAYFDKPALILWQDLTSFIEENYRSSPKISYSTCSGKPGWNVKYQKSGKSLCTIYPEKDGFVVLIVIILDLLPVIEAMSRQFNSSVLELIAAARPFNNTKWLMIPVQDNAVLDSVKELLLLKYPKTRTPGKMTDKSLRSRRAANPAGALYKK